MRRFEPPEPLGHQSFTVRHVLNGAQWLNELNVLNSSLRSAALVPVTAKSNNDSKSIRSSWSEVRVRLSRSTPGYYWRVRANSFGNSTADGLIVPPTRSIRELSLAWATQAPFSISAN
jgi:hypothetical protein